MQVAERRRAVQSAADLQHCYQNTAVVQQTATSSALYSAGDAVTSSAMHSAGGAVNSSAVGAVTSSAMLVQL